MIGTTPVARPERAAAACLVLELLAEFRAQRERIDPLRRDLAGRDGSDVPARTLDVVLACLERATLAHEATLDGIRDQAAGRGVPSLAPWLRRLHADHESALGLLGIAERVCAGFTCAPDASTAQRGLYPALATWNGRQRALQRRESSDLVPVLLAIDPALGQEARPSTIAIRRLETLSPEGRRSEMDVFCPAERRSVRPAWCETCPVVRHVGEGVVQCVPAVPEEPLPADARLGDGTCVGEALARRHLVVLADVAAGQVAASLAKTPATAVVVVDEREHLVGIVDAAEFLAAPPDRRAEELGHAGKCISESASLAEAVACMTRAHARFVAVVGTDDRVIGVLADVDLLHWVASHPRRA